MNHGRSIWLAALAALLVLGSACGDDDGGETKDSGTSSSGGGGRDKDASTSGGGSGSDRDGGPGGGGGSTLGGSGGGGGSTLGDDSDGGGIEQCGAEVCASPMCCADAFQSKCGLQVNARACLPPQPSSTMSDPNCPSVSIMNGAFMIPSCCTADGKCGINAQAAGMGCISLEEVIAFTSSDAGGGTGAGIPWPEPKACN